MEVNTLKVGTGEGKERGYDARVCVLQLSEENSFIKGTEMPMRPVLWLSINIIIYTRTAACIASPADTQGLRVLTWC